MERPYTAQATSLQQQEEHNQPVASTSVSASDEPATPRLDYESRKRALGEGDDFAAVQSTSPVRPCSESSTNPILAQVETASAVSRPSHVAVSLDGSGRGELARRRANRSRRISNVTLVEDHEGRMARCRSEGSLAETAEDGEAPEVGQDCKRQRREGGVGERVIGVPQAGFSEGRAVVIPPPLLLHQTPSSTILSPPSFVATSPTSAISPAHSSSAHPPSSLAPTRRPSPSAPKTAYASLPPPRALGPAQSRRRSASLPPPPRQPHQISHPRPQLLSSPSSHRPSPIPPRRQLGESSSSESGLSLSPARSPSRDGRADSDVFSDPRAIVARIERQGGAWPLSQGDLLAYHAASLLGKGGERISLTPLSLIPPITKATLRELDLAEILRNPQLRHDSVFDPNLMFRPNYDGERGDRKRELAWQYWSAISNEIATGCRCTTYHSGALLPCLCLSPSPKTSATLSSRLHSRIPHLIHELRSILLSLLPGDSVPCNSAVAASREQVMEVLDAGFLAQQIERGILDIGGLARDFLGPTIKLHCAPMRDGMVDEMVQTCGAEGADVVRGLTMAFEILELMKLDIANHQLRSLRPYLVQTAKEFEVRYFLDFAARRETTGSAIFPRTQQWFKKSAGSLATTSIPEIVTSGALDLVFHVDTTSPSSGPVILLLPETFQLDAHRLSSFHSDATDLTVVYLLLSLFQQLCFPARASEEQLDTLRQELWSLLAVANSAAVDSRSKGAGVIAGISKLENAAWREGMKDVGLQIAARATAIKSGSSLPSSKALSLVNAYLTSHLRIDSPVFKLLQARLKSTLNVVVEQQLASFGDWWTAAVDPSLLLLLLGRGRPDTRSKDRTNHVPAARHMAQDSKRVLKRSHEEAGDDSDSDEKRVKIEVDCTSDDGTLSDLSPLDVCLARNGLSSLSTEVRLLGDRIARVTAFHLSVHHDTYTGLSSTI